MESQELGDGTQTPLQKKVYTTQNVHKKGEGSRNPKNKGMELETPLKDVKLRTSRKREWN